MEDSGNFTNYSKLSIIELEKQLFVEKSIQNRNLIRQVIRKKRNEGETSNRVEIEKIEDITTLNTMLNQSDDFFEKCKIRSAILHMEKLKRLKDVAHSDGIKQEQICNDDCSKLLKNIRFVELIKNDLDKKNVTDIVLFHKDYVKIEWILPFKVLSSIECSWYFNGSIISNYDEGFMTISKFNGKETYIELKNINQENNGIYEVRINSTRLKKKCQAFNIIVNEQGGTEISGIIDKEDVNKVNDKEPILCEIKIKDQLSDITKRFHRNALKYRNRTLGGSEFTAAIQQSKQKDSLAADITNSEVAKVPLKKFTRSVTSAKDIILTFCKINTSEYKEEGVSIENLSSSWADGLAFCALIHHFYPDAFDFSKLNSSNRRKNFELAFETAEKYADIYPVLEVDDMMIMDKPDWKCVFTYVQCFYKTFRNHPLNGLRTMLVS